MKRFLGAALFACLVSANLYAGKQDSQTQQVIQELEALQNATVPLQTLEIYTGNQLPFTVQLHPVLHSLLTYEPIALRVQNSSRYARRITLPFIAKVTDNWIADHPECSDPFSLSHAILSSPITQDLDLEKGVLQNFPLGLFLREMMLHIINQSEVSLWTNLSSNAEACTLIRASSFAKLLNRLLQIDHVKMRLNFKVLRCILPFISDRSLRLSLTEQVERRSAYLKRKQRETYQTLGSIQPDLLDAKE